MKSQEDDRSVPYLEVTHRLRLSTAARVGQSVTRLHAERPSNCGFIPDRGKSKHLGRQRGSTQPPFKWVSETLVAGVQ